MRFQARFTLMAVGATACFAGSAAALVVNVATDFGFNALDSTAYFQAALDSGADTVIVPNVGQDWIVSPLQLRSDQQIIFQSGVVVAAKAGAYGGAHSVLMTGSQVSNVSLSGYGATLRMNKSEYTTGEWRHALSLLSTTGVTIEGLTIEDSGGDGIYLGNADTAGAATYNETTLIRDVHLSNHRRQGISVISARNLTIEDVTISNTAGTAPSAGIDFEPNSPTERLEHIIVDGLDLQGNGGSGVLLYLRHLDQSSHPVSIELAHVNALKSGEHGFAIAGSADGLLDGQITLRDSVIDEAGGSGIHVYDHGYADVGIRFENLYMEQTNAGFTGDPIHNPAPITFHVRGSYGANQHVGGVELVDIEVVDIADRSYFTYQDDTGTATFTHMNGTIDIHNPYGYTPPAVYLSITETPHWMAYFNHGFESGTFSLGSLIGQREWSSQFNNGGPATIVTGGSGGVPSAPDGGRLVQVTAGTGSTRLVRPVGPDPTDDPFYVLVDLAYSQLTDGANALLYITNACDNFLGAILGFRAHDGEIFFTYRDGNTFHDLTASGLPQADTFYRFRIDVDPTTATYDLLITDLAGLSIASVTDAHVRGGITAFEFLTINLLDTASGDTFYFDRVVVAPQAYPVPVPAPSTGLLCLGGFPAAVRHRRNRAN